ncbi:unnamed protein product, partial [marine sediment metagenome]
MALIALGEALIAQGQHTLAARAYGSIIDLFPSRADMRRFAGARLESLGKPGLALAADTFSVAIKQRPDHPTGYRLLAYALLRLKKVKQAFETIETALSHDYPSDASRG